MDELIYSVFLPRCENTFKWLELHCDDWNTEDDLIHDYDVVFVSFASLEDAETAYKF
jgi:hypothetical protein